MSKIAAGVPVVIRGTVTITTGTGFKTVTSLPTLGCKGRIVGVEVRHPAGGPITAATFYIVDTVGTPGTATPDDLYTVYNSGSVAITASATTASLMDNVEVDGGGFYDVIKDGDLGLAINVTATGGGATTLIFAIYAVVNATRAS